MTFRIREMAIVLGVLSGVCTLAEDKRPNILFLFADDWGRHASAYAKSDGAGTINDVVSTPNFDKLAASGVLFQNAYVNSPSCTPCRSSLLSGQHFWRTKKGAILQGAVWDETIPSWPLLLESDGYFVGFTYKVWAPGTPRDAPYGGSRNKYQKSGYKFNLFSQTVTEEVGQGKTIEAAKDARIDEVRGNFQQFLDAREKGKPFAYWFGPTNVHRKWTKGSGKTLWGIDPDRLKYKMPSFLPDVQAVREDLADYLGEVQAFDRAIGALIEELKRVGEYENTIIAISGDHGAAGFPYGKCNLYDFGSQVALMISGPGISGGRVVNDFVSLPDLAPTFLEAGTVSVPNVMTAKTLWPVLISTKSGWVDADRSEVYIGRERHVRKAREGNLPYPQRAIRTKDYLFVINFKPERYPLGDPNNLENGAMPSLEKLEENTGITLADEDAGPAKAWLVLNREKPEWKPFFERAYGKRPRYELYDLKKDPEQMNNLADSPEHKEILVKLKAQLLQELKTTDDPRLENDGLYFEDIGKFDS